MPVSSEPAPRLHVLASETELADPATLDILRELVDSRRPVAVHLRARVSAAILFEVARDLAARAWASGGWCVVNGRPDVALAASAQAVQLGRTALSVSDVRRIISHDSEVQIGASVHLPGETEVAAREGASYLVAGTAYATPSHPGAGGIGPAGIAGIVAAVSDAVLPVFAIGGVNEARVGELMAAGATGVVVGRAVWGAPDPVAAARALIDEIEFALP